MMARRNVAIVPGNGAGCASANFYPWLATELRARGYDVALEEMPDPDVAREAVWLPFIRETLGAGPDTLVVGHSSGACAAVRLAETDKLFGVVAVSLTPDDLGDANERASGYYDRPWLWDKVRTNVAHVVQFASTDDPFIPLALMHQARDGFAAGGAAGGAGTFEYIELSGKSHFFERRQREVLEACVAVLKK